MSKSCKGQYADFLNLYLFDLDCEMCSFEKKKKRKYILFSAGILNKIFLDSFYSFLQAYKAAVSLI